jgi:hypothetical protein
LDCFHNIFHNYCILNNELVGLCLWMLNHLIPKKIHLHIQDYTQYLTLVMCLTKHHTMAKQECRHHHAELHHLTPTVLLKLSYSEWWLLTVNVCIYCQSEHNL